MTNTLDIPHQITRKISTLEEGLSQIRDWKRQGDSIVFTNGVFDILHPGHVTYLLQAAALGDRLIVGLNADSSVKKLNKGDDRPIHDEKTRAIMLAALSSTSLIIPFEEETPLALIQHMEPDILVKGGDYHTEAQEGDKHYIVGCREVKSHGGMVKNLDFLEGYSSTAIINKIRGIDG